MENTDKNPLLSDFNTPFGVPPFDKIKTEHYIPAFEESIELARKEVQQIIDNPAAPDFANTIEALERSGRRLDAVSSVFFNLNECLTSDDMQGIAHRQQEYARYINIKICKLLIISPVH